MVFPQVLISLVGAWRRKLKGPTFCIELSRDSRGVWHRNDPIDYDNSVFMAQFIITITAYVILRFLLKPLRQPKFVCSILAGIVASRQVMRLTKIFPENSFPHEEILLKGFSSFLFAAGLSLTRFPNVVYAFDELNIMTSDLGQLATSTSMLCELFVWMRMLMSAYSIGNLKLLWAVLAISASLLVIFGVIGRAIRLIIQKKPEGKPVHELYILSILVGALVIACLTDLIGSLQFGVILFGLVIPNGPPLGSTLTEKIELIAMELFMPMFYADVGYSVDIASINMNNTRKIILLMITGARAKLVGAILCASCSKIRLSHSVLLGLMLNIGGPFDIFLFNRWGATKVGVVFIGGPHDREALALAIRMVGRSDVSATVFRIVLREVARMQTGYGQGDR
ncbi:hypothetical protein NL676_036942 [Syzygium grande]|nr:hypothetical protein NL676_036942 [Syzygium grande]